MATPTGSVRFDRAVEYYDRTRALPPEIDTRQTDLLIGELRGRALEIGVGTGRVALPLVARRVEVVGLDLSRPMMERLRTNAGSRSAVPLVEGDATQLPFPVGAFGGAMASHVFHLVPTWREALAELCRVVRPGGVVLACRGGGWSATMDEVARHFSAEAGLGERRRVVGAEDLDTVDAEARRLGLGVRRLPVIEWGVSMTPDELVERLASNQYSSTWTLDHGALVRAATATRAWSEERFGSLDSAIDDVADVQWSAYDR